MDFFVSPRFCRMEEAVPKSCSDRTACRESGGEQQELGAGQDAQLGGEEEVRERVGGLGVKCPHGTEDRSSVLGCWLSVSSLLLTKPFSF